MENYDHIIEGMLYIRGDEGLDIKEISVVLEVSKKKATELMDEFIEKYEYFMYLVYKNREIDELFKLLMKRVF